MKLFDYLTIEDQGFDCVDNTFDFTIYVELPSPPEADAYDHFINTITKNIDIVATGRNTIAGNKILFVRFDKFIKENIKAFSIFANKNCRLRVTTRATDDDIYNAIRILDDLCIGNYDEEQYNEFNILFVDPRTQYEKDKENARQKAIEWQHEASERGLSYGEHAEAGAYFSKLAKRFGLVQEFKENGII